MDENKVFKKVIISLLLFFAAVVYFAMPPYDKIAQISYCINNIMYYTSANKNDAYLFHRNNALYLARMNNKTGSILEMDKALASVPSNLPESMVNNLYRDRANIQIFFGDYKSALNDYLRIPTHGISDYLKIAMLLKENGNRKLAVSYCNKIIDIDIKAYAGYACIADIYGSVGKYEASVMIFDLLIDRVPNKALYYAERSKYKRLAGDNDGADSDLKTAEELSPIVDTKSSITYDAIHPKRVMLTVL